VAEARVLVGGGAVASIGPGLCVLLGIAEADDEAGAERLAGKVARLRVFENEEGRFDRSLLDTGGSALVVSQFTLIADTGKGNRPSFAAAARPEVAESLYETFCAALAGEGAPVERGAFGARMRVELVNDGPSSTPRRPEQGHGRIELEGAPIGMIVGCAKGCYADWLSSSRRLRNWAKRFGPSCCAQAVSTSPTASRMTRITEVPRGVRATRLERRSSGSGRRSR
jgi:D-tyrosyl-tRNA(Tyr) deacylase